MKCCPETFPIPGAKSPLSALAKYISDRRQKRVNEIVWYQWLWKEEIWMYMRPTKEMLSEADILGKGSLLSPKPVYSLKSS
jgi:hypothetical protein